jgi:microcystin-dependent protein
MNKIVVLGGGFPGTSKTWRFVRDMINEVHGVATALGGENCIVKGCEVTNGSAADGIVIIGGEALPFQGGPVKSHVEIVESIEQVQYFNDSEGDGQADVQDAYFERYARFAAEGTAWADLKRISPLSEVSKRLPPKQCGLPYWGAVNDIPDGWQLCDGSNGTPDLSGMFVVGLDPNDPDHNEIGKTGGSHKHTLTEEELPSHSHSGSVYIKPHKHSLPRAVPAYNSFSGDTNRFTNKDNIGSTDVTETSLSGSQTASFTTASTGGGKSHENRPKFYTMAWIAYTG